MFFSATQARAVFLALVTNDIFFSVRQAVNLAALGTGLVFELPIIAGSTIPHSVEDPVVYPHGFTTLGAVFHDAMTLWILRSKRAHFFITACSDCGQLCLVFDPEARSLTGR